MNTKTQRLSFDGPSGSIEALIDAPVGSQGVDVRGTVVIAHPHPLFGGTMENKVVQTLARAFVLSGWRSIRFNFRGVGKSEGTYDNGTGETQDMLEAVRCLAPDGPLALAGFSFGAFVASQVVREICSDRVVSQIVLVGTAASRFDVAPIRADLHDRTLVVHGEVDDTVPLQDVMRWARPQSLPVTVVPGVEHFFHGQLTLLRSLVVRHIRSSP